MLSPHSPSSVEDECQALKLPKARDDRRQGALWTRSWCERESDSTPNRRMFRMLTGPNRNLDHVSYTNSNSINPHSAHTKDKTRAYVYMLCSKGKAEGRKGGVREGV